MKIEKGKYYRRRDGKIAGPMALVRGNLFGDGPLGPEYLANGNFLIRGGNHRLDLVEEVTVTVPRPDPGYGYQLDGSPVPEPPEGWEIVPEGEQILPDGSDYSTDAMEYEEGRGWKVNVNVEEASFLGRFRAQARKKKPEPRRGKPGEVWRSHNNRVTWFITQTGYTVIDYGRSHIHHHYEEIVSEEHGNTFLAPDLETWARQKWGLGDEERKQLEAEIARLMENHSKRTQEIRRDYVRKSDVIKAITEGGKPIVEAFAKIGIVFEPEQKARGL